MYMYSLCLCTYIDNYFLNLSARYWDAESGEVNLVGGVGHTNLVCSMTATPENLSCILSDLTRTLEKFPQTLINTRK